MYGAVVKRLTGEKPEKHDKLFTVEVLDTSSHYTKVIDWLRSLFEQIAMV